MGARWWNEGWPGEQLDREVGGTYVYIHCTFLGSLLAAQAWMRYVLPTRPTINLQIRKGGFCSHGHIADAKLIAYYMRPNSYES